MFLILLLLVFAYAQDDSNKPTYLWATGFGAIQFAFMMASGVGIVWTALITAPMTMYTWGYFALLRHVSDNTVLWLLVCVAGLLTPLFVLMSFMP